SRTQTSSTSFPYTTLFRSVTFYPLQQALWEVEKSILKGNSLSASLSKHSLFDAKMVALVKVAEETNQNEFIFERLNDQYTAQVRSEEHTSELQSRENLVCR